jgi:hypothetical protein
MTKGKRRYLVAMVIHGTLGLWDADFRWARKRNNEVVRRFANGGGWEWWTRSRYKVTLKQLRGQKR